jgi:hypothetical protein
MREGEAPAEPHVAASLRDARDQAKGPKLDSPRQRPGKRKPKDLFKAQRAATVTAFAPGWVRRLPVGVLCALA